MGERIDQFMLRFDHKYTGTITASAWHYALYVLRYEDPATEQHDRRVQLARIILGRDSGDANAVIGHFALMGVQDPAVMNAVDKGVVDITKLADADADRVVRDAWTEAALLFTPEPVGPEPIEPQPAPDVVI